MKRQYESGDSTLRFKTVFSCIRQPFYRVFLNTEKGPLERNLNKLGLGISTILASIQEAEKCPKCRPVFMTEKIKPEQLI